MGAIIYLLCAAVLGQGFHIAAIHFLAEHYMLTPKMAKVTDPNEALDTFSYYGPFNSILYNGGYHVEHHDLPLIPYRNLPKIREIAPEFYETLPYHTSYLTVMLTFIFS